MTILQRLCPQCMTMIPNIFNGIPFPCPVLKGTTPCKFGNKWIEEEIGRMRKAPKANNDNLKKYCDDTK